MIPGHTKFAPDRFFGLFKKKFRTSNVETVLDMAKVVRSTTDQAINIPQLIADPTTQQQLVHVHKWSEFLARFFKPIPHLLSYQVFSFSSLEKGKVFLRNFCKSNRRSVDTSWTRL